jgi:hypothetical protein
MDIYKTILNAIVGPICEHDAEKLSGVVSRLKESDKEGQAVGEMVERALRYITMTIALAGELAEIEQEKAKLERAIDRRIEEIESKGGKS